MDNVRIPIEDGGWIEVPEDDPRAVEYSRQWDTPPESKPKPKRPTPRPRLPRQAVFGIYTVQSGDTLSAIAQDFLGDARLYPQIAALNKLPDPNLILVGQHLILPSAAEERSPATSASTAGPSSSAGTSSSAGASPSPLMSSMPPNEFKATLALARGFMFVLFEQLPEVGSSSAIIRKVAIVPKNYAFPVPSLIPRLGPRAGVLQDYGPFMPQNMKGTTGPVQHVMDVKGGQSPFLSASDRAFASGSIEGTPMLIDVAKVKAAGGQIMTVDELVAELWMFGAKNPASREAMEKLMWTVSKIEGEVLIKGMVPRGAATPITRFGAPAHYSTIQSAEGLWQAFKDDKISKMELEQGLADLGKSYGRMRVVGRVGRALTVVGVILTAYDLEQAGERSLQQSSIKPLGAEVIRQIGGWGGAAAGAKIGGMLGAAFGIETGPGALITGAVGAIVFGAAGYFGADFLADEISPN